MLAALAASRSFEKVLYQIRADDPATYAAVTVVLSAIALLACWLPAERAAALEPVIVLRED